jgi:hypothetical protein
MSEWTSDELILSIVKRDVSHSERRSIPTFNDLPDWMVEEARAIARVSRSSAARYLVFFVAARDAASVEDFTEDVLFKGQDAKTWNIRDCICCPMELVCTTPSEIPSALEIRYLEMLANEEGERWFRIKPKPTDHLWSWSSGAVGVLKRNLPYWQQRRPISDLVGNYPVAVEDLEPIPPGHLDSSVRRWIARRLAWSAHAYLQQHRSTVTSDDLIAAVPEVDLARVTSDARIAAGALAREAHAFGDSPSFPQQAGFLGPEAWYR